MGRILRDHVPCAPFVVGGAMLLFRDEPDPLGSLGFMVFGLTLAWWRRRSSPLTSGELWLGMFGASGAVVGAAVVGPALGVVPLMLLAAYGDTPLFRRA